MYLQALLWPAHLPSSKRAGTDIRHNLGCRSQTDVGRHWLVSRSPHRARQPVHSAYLMPLLRMACFAPRQLAGVTLLESPCVARFRASLQFQPYRGLFTMLFQGMAELCTNSAIKTRFDKKIKQNKVVHTNLL